MTWTATFTNPKESYSGSGGLSATVPIPSARLHFSFDEVSTITMQIETDVVSKYSLDTADTTNPLQLNSQLLFQRDSDVWFRGVVASKPYYTVAISDKGDVVNYLAVDCRGDEFALTRALCPDANGEYIWSVSTSTVQVGAAHPYLPLQPSVEFGTFNSPTLWPDPADATGAKCYLQNADSSQDAYSGYEDDTGFHADTLPAAGTTPIGDILFYLEFGTANAAFAPQGWLVLDSEWFYYEGYDPTGQSSAYRVAVKARAELGTTAAEHTLVPATTGYNKVGKTMGPEPPTVYKDAAGGTTFVAMRYNSEYKPHHTYGCFVISEDVGSSSFASTHYVYDSDKTLDGGSTVISLEDVVELIVTAPEEFGGAGFVAGDLDFDVTGINITRYDYSPKEKGQYAWQVIASLIQGLNLQDEVEFWYDHTQGKFRLAIIGNAVTPDFQFTNCSRVEREMSIDDVYSGVLVEYTNDEDPNLANADNAWHVGAAAAGAKPDTWYQVPDGGASWEDGSNAVTSVDGAASNFGMTETVDGKLDSKLKAEILHDPADEFVFGEYWFGNGTTPPKIQLDEIRVFINSYRSTADRTRHNTDNTYVFRIDGATDYDTSSHTATDWQQLGAQIQGVGARDGTSVELQLTEFIRKEVNAIRLVWEYMAGPVDDGHKYWGCVHNLIITGDIVKYSLVQTTDSAALQTNPAYVYDVDAHVKLRGGINADSSAGSPRIDNVSIGAASEAAALTIGAAYLKTSLLLYSMRNYTYLGALTSKPEIGDTVATDETGSGSADYTGVIRELDVDVAADQTTTDYGILDYDAARIS